MAALSQTTQTVQVVNLDLATERQNVLREKLGQYFKALSQKAKVKKRLVYTVNADESPMDKVLRSNRGADAVFTGFHYDARHSEAFKDTVSVTTTEEILQVDPQLRYPVIAEFHKFIDLGLLRHTKLFLVGDLHQKIEGFIRSDLPVFITFHPSADRHQVSQSIQITSADRLDPNPGAEPMEGKPIPVSSIHTIRVADILFDGVINMPEEANRFVLKDQTLLDTARKLYVMDSVKEQVTQDLIREDRLHFVRGKRVFIVLDADLEHVVSDRLNFDRMDNLWRHHTLAEALVTLERGKSKIIAEYFETQGYAIVFELLNQEERDKLMVAVLGDRLPSALTKEMQTVRPMVAQLEEADLDTLFYNLPQAVLTEVLEGVKNRHYDRFLSMVPPKIRESVILEFLGSSERVQLAWRGIPEAERKEILGAQAPLVLAMVYLLASDLFKRKFPALKFDFQRNYDSTLLANMGLEEQQATFIHLTKNLKRLSPPKGLITAQLSAEEIERFMSAYITRNAQEFYNRLSPVVRKQIWLTVGREYRDQISKGLHALDKIEILKSNKDAAVELLFANEGFMRYVKSGEDREFAATLFLLLKKLNKTESKSALLKKLLASPELKTRRIKAVPAFLADPENAAIYEKLAEHVDELDFKFDSLICTKAVFRELLGKPPLQNAVVTLVDELVDPSLFNLFETSSLSREEYDQFSRTVDKQLVELRRKMAAREKDDPVGAYLLETMQILNEMSNQTLTDSLSADIVQRLDSRQAIQQRMMDSLRERVRRIDASLEQATRQMPHIERKIEELQPRITQQEQIYEAEYRKANALLAQCQQLIEMQRSANRDRKKVALTQKELSLQFFQIIQPLILDKVRSLGNPLRSLLRMVGIGAKETVASTARVIFQFSDAEIANILRYKIVFCAKDAVLAQFVATCLRIDHLEDTLFTLATAETLPHKSDIDILFYGPGYSVEDFADSVKQHRMVPFADQVFYERLLTNEKLKARTKAILVKTETVLREKKRLLGTANGTVKTQQAKRRQLEAGLLTLQNEKTALEQTMKAQQERRHRLLGEQELLQSRLAEVDAQFERVKAQVTELTTSGSAGAGSALQAGKMELSDRLRDDLTALNKQLARMMFIKGVRDAGNEISSETQNGILERIEAREHYDYAKRPFKQFIVADDSSPTAQNLKHVFINVALTYLKLNDRAVREMSVARLGALAETDEGKKYPFVVLITDRPEDNYGALKQVVKQVHRRLPEIYQLVITPFGNLEKMNRASSYQKNLAVLRENSALVNAALADYSDPGSMLRVLREKIPQA